MPPWAARRRRRARESELAEAIEATLPHRRFRDPNARLFASSGADALRTSIARACRAAGIPLSWRAECGENRGGELQRLSKLAISSEPLFEIEGHLRPIGNC
jgi:hypothetical protein